MSEFKLSGRIYKIGEVQKVTDSFSVQKFRIETDDQYPQKIEFQAVNDRCVILEPYKIGDLITVHFDVRGRDWSKGDREGNATNLNAWKIERVGDQSVAPTAMTAQSAPQAAPAPVADDSAQALFGDDEAIGGLLF
jgi:single-strand DNA-binding protein